MALREPAAGVYSHGMKRSPSSQVHGESGKADPGRRSQSRPQAGRGGQKTRRGDEGNVRARRLIELAAILLLLGVLAALNPPSRVGQAAQLTVRRVAEASRVFPAYADWLVPMMTWEEWPRGVKRLVRVRDARQLFRAEAPDADRSISRAVWRVRGPEERDERGILVREGRRVASEYKLRVSTPGQYTIVCRFVEGNATQLEVPWSLMVSDDPWAVLGRKAVDPSEPGQMTFIKGGAFQMGAPKPSPRGVTNAMPAHEVRVGDFYIGTYLVTASEFCKFLNECGNPEYRYLLTDDSRSRPIAKYKRLMTLGRTLCNIYLDTDANQYRPRPNRTFCPASGVTWFGAVEYCRWLSERSGERYRLPTEAEWEYAARGPEGRRYPWGSADPFPKGKGATREAAAGYTAGADAMYTTNYFPGVNIGSFPRGNTPEGVTDLTSGMGQWCSDVYSPEWYSVSPRDNPTGPQFTPAEWARDHGRPFMRVMRGASVEHYTNYNDVTLWPLFHKSYYYMAPAWTREAVTPTPVEGVDAWGGFGPHRLGFRVVREAK